jgi:indolepyruvate ferredoxin oxidoreductase
MGGREDLDFKFVDQKGLAQRNGNVTAHLAIFKKGDSYGAITPQGSADLLVSPDLLDGAKHISYLSESGELILDELYQTPLSILLDEGDVKPPLSEEALRGQLKDRLGQRAQVYPLKRLSELALGRAVYASAMILGVAFQKGRLPFSLQDMKIAFEGSMKKGELEKNWQAFELGRDLVENGVDETLSRFEEQKKKEHKNLLAQSLRESVGLFESSSKLIEKYENALSELKGSYSSLPEEHLAQYIHDILIYDRGVFLEKFLEDAEQLTQTYSEKDWPQMLRTLAKTYWVKDEVYVAHLMISPVQRFKDQERYQKLGSGHKKVRMNRPEFKLGSKSIEFEMNPRDWMLKLTRHQRWLRSLLPGWHEKEKTIARQVRSLLLSGPAENESSYEHLARLENIKGYRKVRYEKAKKKLGEQVQL